MMLYWSWTDQRSCYARAPFGFGPAGRRLNKAVKQIEEAAKPPLSCGVQDSTRNAARRASLAKTDRTAFCILSRLIEYLGMRM
jgi:hypothetical protein